MNILAMLKLTVKKQMNIDMSLRHPTKASQNPSWVKIPGQNKASRWGMRLGFVWGSILDRDNFCPASRFYLYGPPGFDTWSIPHHSTPHLGWSSPTTQRTRSEPAQHDILFWQLKLKPSAHNSHNEDRDKVQGTYLKWASATLLQKIALSKEALLLLSKALRIRGLALFS